MKLFIKLGIVLGLIITIIACQKEEVSISSSDAWDQSAEEVFKGADATQPGAGEDTWTTPDGVEPQLPTPDWDNTPGVTDPTEPTYFDEPVEDRLWVEADDNLVMVQGEIEAIYAERWENNVTIEWVDKMPSGDHWIFVDTSLDGRDAIVGPEPACPYEDCDTAIPALIAQYQPIANQECRNIWICIPCCIDKSIVYVTLVIRHNCGIIPAPSEY